jgi:hypothetical protein
VNLPPATVRVVLVGALAQVDAGPLRAAILGLAALAPSYSADDARDVCNAIAVLMAHGDSSVRAVAIEALVRASAFGNDDTKRVVAAALEQALAERSDAVRARALEALVGFAPIAPIGALDGAVSAIGNGIARGADRWWRASALAALRQMPQHINAAVPWLVMALGADGVATGPDRLAIVELVAAARPSSPSHDTEVVLALVAQLDDTSPAMLIAALDGLAIWPTPACDEAAPHLKQLIAHTDLDVQRYAIWACGRLNYPRIRAAVSSDLSTLRYRLKDRRNANRDLTSELDRAVWAMQNTNTNELDIAVAAQGRVRPFPQKATSQ